MRDREKSFKQKIKEERRELKQDREKLTKLLIEKQKQIKDEVDASLQIKIKKQNELILDLRGKIKDAKNKVSSKVYKQKLKEIRKNLRKVDED